jgi:hypothetical protein
VAGVGSVEGRAGRGRIDPIKNVTATADGRIANRAGHPEKIDRRPEIKDVHAQGVWRQATFFGEGGAVQTRDKSMTAPAVRS